MSIASALLQKLLLLISLFLCGLVGALYIVRGKEADTGWIVFVSNRTGNRDLYRILPNGKGVYNLTRSSGDDGEPTYSPDGQWLVFTSTRNGNRDIFLMNIAGRELRALTTHPENDMHPQWDDDVIYFLTARHGDFRFYQISDTGMQEALTPPLTEPPQKSPDGKTLVSNTIPGDIYLISAEDESGGAGFRLTTDPAYDCCGTWSPNGQWIVFESTRSGNRDLFRIRPDGNNLTQITHHPASDRGAVWFPSIDYPWHPIIGIAGIVGMIILKLGRSLVMRSKLISLR